MNKLEYYLKAIKYYSPKNLCFRLKYAMLLKSSFFAKRFPQYSWSSYSLDELLINKMSSDPVSYRTKIACEKRDNFFFDPSRFSSFDSSTKDYIISQADAIVAGKVTYFSKLEAQFDGVPDWFKNPFTGQQADSASHWTNIGDFSSEQGDIKFIWEPSRFAWVYPLVRAYAVTSDRKYAEHFWKWFEDWLEKNPPNTGPNYKCGQAWAFSDSGGVDSKKLVSVTP